MCCLVGYCYFNRKIDDEEKARLQKANKPVKIDASLEKPGGEVQKALSSWNSQGTTYEERGQLGEGCSDVHQCPTSFLKCISVADCSSWAHGVLSTKLQSIVIEPRSTQETVSQYVDVRNTVTRVRPI